MCCFVKNRYKNKKPRLKARFKSDTAKNNNRLPNSISDKASKNLQSNKKMPDIPDISDFKANWLFGSWTELIDIDLALVKNHIDRDKYAILCGAANFQLGYEKKAQEAIRLALEWGCDKKLVAKLLVAGVYNSLGAAATLSGNELKQKEYYSEAIDLGESNKSASNIITTRRLNEITRLGLEDQIGKIFNHEINITNGGSLHQLKIKDQILKYEKNKKKPVVIVVASMPRSGSTWLFNCVKKIIESKYDTSYCCWIGDYNPQNKSEIHLVKVHDPNSEICKTSDKILSTRRDIREVAASLVRLAWDKQDKEFYDQLCWIVEQVHPFWYERTNFEIEYQSIINQPISVVEQIGHVLNMPLEMGFIKEVVKHLDSLESPKSYDQETQMHPNHRSLKKVNLVEILDTERLNTITSRFRPWLEEFRYIKGE